MLECCCLLIDGQGNRASTLHAEQTELRRRLNQTDIAQHGTLPGEYKWRILPRIAQACRDTDEPSMNLRFQDIHWTDPNPTAHQAPHACTLLCWRRIQHDNPAHVSSPHNLSEEHLLCLFPANLQSGCCAHGGSCPPSRASQQHRTILSTSA